jgi:hypothetical protein
LTLLPRVPAREAREPLHLRRLRDLRGWERALALTTLALAVVPFVVALVRAFGDGWVPSGDEANIAVRALDVFSGHPPLTGLPSTSFFYGDRVFTYHPGPLEFYVLAVPLRVLGATTGPLLMAACVNAAFVLVSLWVFLRHGGVTVMLWAAVVLQTVMWSAGTSILTDTLSSSMTMYPVLGTAVVVWAVANGDYRLLPLAALFGSYAAQQHLAAGFMVAALSIIALVSLGIAVWLRRPADGDGDDNDARDARPGAIGAIAGGVVCWAPVLVDEIKGRPGNLTAIFRFTLDNDRETLGLSVAMRQAARALVPPSVLTRTDTTGNYFNATVTPIRMIAAVGVVVALIGVAFAMRRRQAPLSRLAIVALTLLAAGVYTGSNVPFGIEVNRPNLYRWTWTAAFLTWVTLGWAIAIVVRDRARTPTTRATRALPYALATLAALITLATVLVQGSDDHNREAGAFRVERAIGRAVIEGVDHDERVLVVPMGSRASINVAAYVVYRLVETGVPITLLERDAVFLGRHRAVQPDDDVPVLVIRSAVEPLPRIDGDVIAEVAFDPELTRLTDELTTIVQRDDVEFAPNAAAIIEKRYPAPDARALVKPALEQLRTDPAAALRHRAVLELIVDGVVRSPTLDVAKVRRLLDRRDDPTTFLGAERVQAVLVPADQARPIRERLE